MEEATKYWRTQTSLKCYYATRSNFIVDNVQSLHKQFLLLPVIIIMNALSFVQTILSLQVMIVLRVC